VWLRVNGFFPTTDAPSTQRDLNIFASVGALGLLAVTIWGWRAYYKFSIRTDERGITQTGWRGEKFVDWQDIIDFYRGDNSFYITAKSGVRLRFGNNIADCEILRDEIARRAVNAEVLPSWTQESSRTGT